MIKFLKKYIWKEDFERICELETELKEMEESYVIVKRNNIHLQAENSKLKTEIIEKLTEKIFENEGRCFNVGLSEMTSADMPGYLAVFVEDLAGGKVIKQEANKCIKISKEGDVEEGYTKKRCDKNYNYKLIREK